MTRSLRSKTKLDLLTVLTMIQGATTQYLECASGSSPQTPSGMLMLGIIPKEPETVMDKHAVRFHGCMDISFGSLADIGTHLKIPKTVQQRRTPRHAN